MAKLVVGVNDLKSLRPDLAAEYSKDNTQPLDSVFVSSNKKYLWDGSCGHRWEATANHRSGGRGCPFCSGRRLLPGFNDLATLKPELARCISPNSPLKGHEVLANSTKRILVICPDCGEEREIKVSQNLTARCKSCGAKNSRPQAHRTLKARFPEIAREVSPDSPYSPSEVSAFSLKKLLWICPNGHPPYFMAVHNRTYGKSSCPICVNQKIVPGINDLATTHPHIAALVDPNSPLRPSEVSAKGSKKMAFKCENGHTWTAFVKNVVNGSGCPKCSYSSGGSQGEKEVADFVESAGFSVERNNRTVLDGLEIDVWIPNLNVGIEYNGNYWHSLREAKAKDLRKRKLAKKKGVDLIVVWEDDWRNETTKQQNRLLKRLIAAEKATSSQAQLAPKHSLSSVLPPKKTASNYGEDFFLADANLAISIATEADLAGASRDFISVALEAERNGVEAITIFPWHDREKIAEMLAHKQQESERIFARKTKAYFLDKNTASPELVRRLGEFIAKNHVLGFRPRDARYYTWLVHQGEIVAAASWGERRLKIKATTSQDNSIELVRLAFKSKTAVVGGASKLLHKFLNSVDIKIEKIFTFSDFDLGSGNVYETLGFKVIASPKRQKNYVNFAHLKPDGRPWRIKHTSLVMAGADRLLKNFPGYSPVGMDCRCEDTFHPKAECLPSNVEILKNYGFIEVFDCGYKKWEYTVPAERQA